MAKIYAPDVMSRRNWRRFMKTIQTPMPHLQADEQPRWPLGSVDPEQWEALPAHVRQNISKIVAEYIVIAHADR